MAKAKAKRKGKKKGRQAKLSKRKKGRKAARPKARKGATKKKAAARKKSSAPKRVSYSEPAPVMAQDTTPEVTTFATDMTTQGEPSSYGTSTDEPTYSEYTGSDDRSSSSSN
jgi:hypothetical protein